MGRRAVSAAGPSTLDSDIRKIVPMSPCRKLTALLPVLTLLALCACATRTSAPGSTAGDAPEQTRPATELVEELWPDGSIRMRKEVIRQPDGTLINHGTYTTWHRGGLKAYEGAYAYGKLDGVERTWHDNGRQRTEQYYRNGLRQGPRRDWDPEGNLVKEENYVEDVPHGTWTIWKDDGTIKWRGYFDHGQPVSAPPN